MPLDLPILPCWIGHCHWAPRHRVYWWPLKHRLREPWEQGVMKQLTCLYSSKHFLNENTSKSKERHNLPSNKEPIINIISLHFSFFCNVESLTQMIRFIHLHLLAIGSLQQSNSARKNWIVIFLIPHKLTDEYTLITYRLVPPKSLPTALTALTIDWWYEWALVCIFGSLWSLWVRWQ